MLLVTRLAAISFSATRGTPAAPRVDGVRQIADRYDAFLLDQFGVLHDGSTALRGAVECYNELRDLGKKLIVLSNTSRRKEDAIKKLGRLGFDVSALSDFVCSGEQAWQHMAAKCGGKRVLWLGWSDDYLGFDNAGFLDGLDVSVTPSAEEADVILAQGTQLIRSTSAEAPPASIRSLFEKGEVEGVLLDVLRRCQERGVPMLCANPDFQATQPDGSVGYMPGIVAECYEDMGGPVTHFGKPYHAAFDACLERLEGIPRSRVCHVGDSLLHDVAGANSASLDSLFVASGIHGSALPERDSPAYADALLHLYEETAARPTYDVEDFKW
jgi:HAD superfamily hydrolase (TIGR01450 family)